MQLRRFGAAALAATALVALSGCQSAGSDKVELSLRLWDEQVASAYETSIAAFEAANPNIDVKVDVVPWKDYFTTLRTDVGSGSGPDVFWLNGASFQDYVGSDSLVNIDETLGADAKAAWNSTVVEQYSANGVLYGVPQLTDGGSALYVNSDLLSAAGVTPQELSDAVWSPSGPDTLLPLLQKLTVDANGNNAASPQFDANNVASYGFNAGNELQNVVLNFIGSNGGTYQDPDGKMTFTDPKTEEAFGYVTKLINEAHVAPPAESTNDNADYTRDLFLQGKLAVFSSGTYNLKNVHDGAAFPWSITEIPAGPVGKVTTAPGVIAAGNAKSAHPEQTAALLKWLGSTEGASPIGAEGSAIPAVTDARAAYDAYWKAQGVDTSAFFTVTQDNPTIAPVTGKNFQAQQEAFQPLINEIFLGRLAVGEGLQQAQAAADAAA